MSVRRGGAAAVDGFEGIQSLFEDAVARALQEDPRIATVLAVLRQPIQVLRARELLTQVATWAGQFRLESALWAFRTGMTFGLAWVIAC